MKRKIGSGKIAAVVFAASAIALAADTVTVQVDHIDLRGGKLSMSPVVATAWGRQLAQDSVDLPRLSAFVDTFAQGPQTPELGAPCTGGMG